MKKRFIAGLLAIVLTLSLAACNGNPADGTGSSGSDLSVSVTDTEPADVSSSVSDLPSDSGSSVSGTDTVSDSATTGSDTGDLPTDTGEDSDGDSEIPSDDFSQGDDGAPDEDGGGEDTDVYLPGYQPSTDDGESSTSSTNKNTSSASGNTDTNSDAGTSSASGNAVVGTTLEGLMAITDQKNGAIAVVDLSKSDITSSAALVWEWNPRMYGDVPYRSADKHLDDVVIREVYGGLFNGTVVGVTSSSGLVAVVEYPSGKCLFNANAAGYGPHDIEILPNGLVAVACSGNSNAANSRIRIYRARSKTDGNYVEVSDISSAHGVLWDPTEKVLWGLGGDTLNAYQIGGSPSSSPTITQVNGKGRGGFSGGHCLSPVYGNPDRLWISVGSLVYQYSKSENRLYSDYPGNQRISVRSVKSVNNYANGTAVWTAADANNATATHNTDTVQILYYEISASGKRTAVYKNVKFSNRDFYKVRVFDTAYQ